MIVPVARDSRGDGGCQDHGALIAGAPGNRLSSGRASRGPVGSHLGMTSGVNCGAGIVRQRWRAPSPACGGGLGWGLSPQDSDHDQGHKTKIPRRLSLARNVQRRNGWRARFFRWSARAARWESLCAIPHISRAHSLRMARRLGRTVSIWTRSGCAARSARPAGYG